MFAFDFCNHLTKLKYPHQVNIQYSRELFFYFMDIRSVICMVFYSGYVGIIFIEMLAELEKIGDNLSNIAERTPQIQEHYFDLG